MWIERMPEAPEPTNEPQRFPESYALTLRDIARREDSAGQTSRAAFLRRCSIIVGDAHGLRVALRASGMEPGRVSAWTVLADVRKSGKVCEGTRGGSATHAATSPTWQCQQCGCVLCEACEPAAGTCAACFDIVF